MQVQNENTHTPFLLITILRPEPERPSPCPLKRIHTPNEAQPCKLQRNHSFLLAPINQCIALLTCLYNKQIRFSTKAALHVYADHSSDEKLHQQIL